MGTGGRLIALVAVCTALICGGVPATASAASITISAVPLSPVEGTASAGPVATFIDSPTGHTAADFTASVAWGDGVTQSAVVSGSDAAGWTVTPSAHTYREEGIYPLAVTVSDTVTVTTSTLNENVTVADAPIVTPVSGSPQGFAGTGAGATNAENAFTAAIGGGDNGSAGPQASGFRSLNWDAIAISSPDPAVAAAINAHTVALTPQAVQPRGLELDSPVAVANDGFASVNPGTSGRLAAPSSPNDAAAIGGNVIELDIVGPAAAAGTTVPRTTRGLGVVLKNVSAPGSTWLEFFDGTALIDKVFAPTGAPGGNAFVGVVFPAPVVSRVVIHAGSAMVFGWDGTTISPGRSDSTSTNLVAADDIVLAEPAVAHTDLTATAGIPFSGQVGSFADLDQNAASPPTASDFVAEIDWGDGVTTPGSVSGSGPFGVGGTHSYGAAGSYPVTVTETDRGGARRVEHFTMAVAPRATATAVSCVPNLIRAGSASVCTATVSDTGSGSPSAPSGTVGFTSTAGGGFASGASCALMARSANASSCTTTFTALRSQAVVGAYSGDGRHSASSGAGGLSVLGHGCTLGIPSPKLSAQARTLRVLVQCDQAGTVKIAATATIGRRGSRRGGRVSLGTATGRAAAGRPLTLVLRPSPKTLAALRSAGTHHQPISLALSLTATASATTRASLTLRSLTVS